jgi:hypothetical protein
MRGFVAGLLIGIALVSVAFAAAADDPDQRRALIFASVIAIAAGFGLQLAAKDTRCMRSR